MTMDRLLVLCVSSASCNAKRRRALRRSWFTFKTKANPWVTPQQQQSLELCFVVSAGSDRLQVEQAEHGDMLILDAPEGYAHLWRKALTSLQLIDQKYQYAYYMHADDDSYVRLDLILQLLANSPREKFYWGYIWDGTGNRHTQPIRNPMNKSHMPTEQYPLDYYPPFASGCGFILSRDLVVALLQQPLPDYRLLDPPFGIHLCGREFCVLPDGPVLPVHDDRVRPYRGIPVFQPTTIIQHYLTPEEMAPFHTQVLSCLQQQQQQQQQQDSNTQQQHALLVAGDCSSRMAADNTSQDTITAADLLYAQLVEMGLLRR